MRAGVLAERRQGRAEPPWLEWHGDESGPRSRPVALVQVANPGERQRLIASLRSRGFECLLPDERSRLHLPGFIVASMVITDVERVLLEARYWRAWFSSNPPVLVLVPSEVDSAWAWDLGADRVLLPGECPA